MYWKRNSPVIKVAWESTYHVLPDCMGNRAMYSLIDKEQGRSRIVLHIDCILVEYNLQVYSVRFQSIIRHDKERYVISTEG